MLFDIGCLKKNVSTQNTFHVSPITSVYALTLHAKLDQLIWINQERHLLLPVAGVY